MKGIEAMLVQPDKELGLDLARVTAEARERYDCR